MRPRFNQGLANTPLGRPPLPGKKLLLATALVCLPFACPAAQTPTNTPSKTSASPPATTKAAPVEPEIPKSVFSIPTTPAEGKDPFYPSSMRLFASLVVTPTNQPTRVTVELQLKALSGTPDHRLAIINNHTFEVGEEEVVTTTTAAVRIRCLEINQDSVVVLVGGQQRTLHLRPGI